MSDRFSFRRGSSGESDPWFRLGTVDVGTTMLVTLLAIVAFFLYALSPALVEGLGLVRDDVLAGQVWQLASWPLANAPTLWSAITIFLFWYFGNELERTIGRRRFGWLLGLTTVAMSVVAIALSLAFASYGPTLFGLGALELIVILVFIGENPHIRFFFGIPGWLIAVVLVVLPILGMIGDRDLIGVLNLLLGLAVAAVIARGQGLLGEYAAIPSFHRPHRNRSSSRRRSLRRHPSSGTRPTVVEGPWLSAGAAGSAQAELDALLDKISEGGLESLSAKERNRLHDLRRQLRGE